MATNAASNGVTAVGDSSERSAEERIMVERVIGVLNNDEGLNDGAAHTGPAKQAYIRTATICGVDARLVTVEISVGRGMPGTFIVGMPDTAVQEAKLRVRTALRAAGFDVPLRVVVNLAPSSLRKNGSGFDLPIALGILVATGQIPCSAVEDRLCVGELSLDGSVRPVSGFLAYEKLAVANGLGLLTAPVERGVYSDKPEAGRGRGHDHVCLRHLSDIATGNLSGPYPRSMSKDTHELDFSEIAGNDAAKRALQISAAGQHAIMMIGPPGSGKSMMAARLPTILPLLSNEKRLESALIHSVAGLPFEDILKGRQPFRAPHHSASPAGLLGGGSPPAPGEVSLAHNGVLFLDEMPEFGSSVLQMLRQPIETGTVSLARAKVTTVFPARFLLVAAANPCPCGYFGDAEHTCKCTQARIEQYQNRIGGPLMDRFDLVVHVWRSPPSEVLATGSGTSSKKLRDEVCGALEFRAARKARGARRGAHDGGPGAARFEALGHTSKNTSMLAVNAEEFMGRGELLLSECGLGTAEHAFLEEAATKYKLSGRGIMRALSVARTIADLEAKARVSSDHLLEAIGFRTDGGEDI
ncbi:MAG: YifB family Mg chelatase-like AAA ATPase [Coriobacteriales bacterium]|jgi:magnesium chelatase family protein|nr:YifB family Mg chelatase-like AAA ATPase [Coriobacteriales bacterium]